MDELLDFSVAGWLESLGVPVEPAPGAPCCIGQENSFSEWPAIVDKIARCARTTLEHSKKNPEPSVKIPSRFGKSWKINVARTLIEV